MTDSNNRHLVTFSKRDSIRVVSSNGVFLVVRHEWCTAAGGSFLHLAIERLSEELVLRMEDEGVSDIPTADIEYDMEQCFYCLYGLTKNKNRYLQNHSALQVGFLLCLLCQRAIKDTAGLHDNLI